MADAFYTISLPRSRSAWLSMFLQSDISDCYHEALTSFGSAVLPETHKKYIGSCDTNPLNEIERNGPTIKVVRSLNEVSDSILKSFDNPFGKNDFRAFIEKWLLISQRAFDQIKGFQYHFNDLNDIECLKEISLILKPKEEFNEIRARKLVDTRISTINRDLKPSIEHTASQFNMSVPDFYEYIVEQG